MQPSLEDALLAHLARDDADEPAFQPLTTIYETAPLSRWKQTFSRPEQGIDDLEALRVALDQLVTDGMAERQWGEREYEPSYRVTQDGFYEATVGSNFVVEDNSGRASFDEDIFDPSVFDTSPTVDSSAWTGLAKEGVLTDVAVRNLRVALKVADNALEQVKASNEEKAQARAYLIALHALAEAPDPPADVIWTLIMRLAAMAGVAQAFIALVGLYK